MTPLDITRQFGYINPVINEVKPICDVPLGQMPAEFLITGGEFREAQDA
jgi:hypothetical protein